MLKILTITIKTLKVFNYLNFLDESSKIEKVNKIKKIENEENNENENDNTKKPSDGALIANNTTESILIFVSENGDLDKRWIAVINYLIIKLRT